MYLVECNPDTVLIKILTLASRKNIVHAGNKSELLKKLTERYSNSKGIVDEDPWSIQPPHLQKFKEKQDLTRHNLKILHQTNKNNTLIVIRPRLEEWILEASREANLNLKKYKLPDDATRLHRQINIKIDKLEELLTDLKQNSNRIKTLKKYLQTRKPSYRY